MFRCQAGWLERRNGGRFIQEVADATRLALKTQGRSPVEAAVKRGADPPARIVLGIRL